MAKAEQKTDNWCPVAFPQKRTQAKIEKVNKKKVKRRED